MPLRTPLLALLLLASLCAARSQAARYAFTGEVTHGGELGGSALVGTPIVGEVRTTSSSAPFGVEHISAQMGVFSLDHDGPMRLTLGSGLDQRDHLVLQPDPPPGSLITAMGPRVWRSPRAYVVPIDFLIDIVQPRGTLDNTLLPVELGASLEPESSYITFREFFFDMRVAFRVTSFTQVVPCPSTSALAVLLAAGIVPQRLQRRR